MSKKMNRKQNQRISVAAVKKQLTTAYYEGLKDGMCIQVAHSLILKPVIIRSKYAALGKR